MQNKGPTSFFPLAQFCWGAPFFHAPLFLPHPYSCPYRGEEWQRDLSSSGLLGTLERGQDPVPGAGCPLELGASSWTHMAQAPLPAFHTETVSTQDRPQSLGPGFVLWTPNGADELDPLPDSEEGNKKACQAARAQPCSLTQL